MQPNKVEAEEEDEFLSPESESEHDDDIQKLSNAAKDSKQQEQSTEEIEQSNETQEKESSIVTPEIPVETPSDNAEIQTKSDAENDSDTETPSTNNEATTPVEETVSLNDPEVKDSASPKPISQCSENDRMADPNSKQETPEDEPRSPLKELEEKSTTENVIEPQEMVSEAIEEPVMLITGEGNGADCESSYFIGEEISEPVMYFFGEGYGFDNDTGNPEAIEKENDAQKSDDDGSDECINGENHEVSNSSISKSPKSVKLKSKVPAVTKRSLKKQSTDPSEALKPDGKKPCVRNLDKSDSSNSNSKGVERDLKRESSVNDKSTTDSESSNKNNVKKNRSKVKKKPAVARKLKVKNRKNVTNSVAEPDNGHDSKTSIIEKRKSSLSSEDQEEEITENEKEKSPDKDLKGEDTLPPKKLRLETTPESDAVSHSKETVDTDINNSDDKKETQSAEKKEIDSAEKKDNQKPESNSISQRKKIKASKGKFKRKRVEKIKQGENDNEESDLKATKSKSKAVKRSLLDATMSDKSKSESQSDSEEDEPALRGKRLKIKPKKIVKSSR